MNIPGEATRALTAGRITASVFEQPQHETPAWHVVRLNIRRTRLLSDRVHDIARMQPRGDLASSGFCLANEGEDYIVYVPRQEEIRVRGLQVGRKYQCEWFNGVKGSVEPTAQITSETAALELRPPSDGTVLFLTLVPEAKGPASPKRDDSTPLQSPGRVTP